MKKGYSFNLSRLCIGLSLIMMALLVQACPGPDVNPNFFGGSDETQETNTPPTNDESATPKGTCTVNFQATLCVAIKGDNIEAGIKDSLCAEELPPIPIQISGSNVELHGDVFPDIIVSGHGLPVPITLNAKGSTNGSDNIGKGTIDADGSITINDFSFFITALGMVGKVPSLTLTTGSTEELPDLAATSGAPIGADGSMTLVTGTVLGHLIPAADEKLFGASMTATFAGTVDPKPSDCEGGDSGPKIVTVTKLIVSSEGKQIEEQIPNNNMMEVGTGAFIAVNPADIGPRFTASAKFKIVNVSEEAIALNLPPHIGPFIISSTTNLIKKLNPKEPVIITVTFYPTADTVDKPGEVDVPLNIGGDTFHLISKAMSAKGRVEMDLLDENGKVIKENVQAVDLGTVQVPSSSRKEFFQCEQILCNNEPLPTKCQPCLNITGGTCQLLTIDTSGKPVDEMDANCQPFILKPTETSTINLAGTQSVPIHPTRKVIQIRNTGPVPLTIKGIDIAEIANTKSTKQFVVKANAIFQADDYASIQSDIQNALKNGATQGDPLPITLNPYDPPEDIDKVFVVVSYEPSDLVGSDGMAATIGNTVTDKAYLRVSSDSAATTMDLSGATTIKDIPALQVFFRTTTGVKGRDDGSTMPFRDITADTADAAIPLFIKLDESAQTPLRVQEMKISGPDAAFFEWLDTAEKINAKPEGARCTIPIVPDNASGQTGIIKDLKPVSVGTQGFTLKPGSYSLDTMPLFGCVNFHRDITQLTPEQLKKRQFSATLTVTVQELKNNGEPARNADGSIKQSTFSVKLLAVISPLKGRLILRVTQTMAVILNPQFPSISASAHKKELDLHIADGIGNEEDRNVFLGAMILDPFDEEEITNEDGSVVSTPGDGITAVFRPVDTHPTKEVYEDPLFYDYTSMIYNNLLPEGKRGVFFDYPNKPEDFKANGLKVYTATLSYPGPLALPDDRPEEPSLCENVDPCSIEGQRKLGQGNPGSGKRGVCAYFYMSAGSVDSPAFHYPDEPERGDRRNMCNYGDDQQNLKAITGSYSLDGILNFEDVGLMMWGPTYFHNPFGPLGPAAPLNEFFKNSFTTGVMLPPGPNAAIDFFPDKRIDIARSEHKINLNDNNLTTAQLCANNIKNRYIKGNYYSTWQYLKPFLVKDESGETPAGCPEAGLPFTGGSAFVRGKPINHETGAVAFATATKFGSSDNLTFAFKDVMMFFILNGWFCDPLGPEEEMEGSHCYDLTFNDRDAVPQIAIHE